MDGSTFSSPLESPEAPVTSSVVTLQSAESLSYRRQVRLLCSNEPVVVNNNHHKTTTTPPPSEELLPSEEPPSPSAVLTPSSPDTLDANENSSSDDDIDFLNFYEEPWDITNFQYDLRLLTLADDQLTTGS